MITCKILPNGDLKLTAGNAARSELKSLRERFGYWQAMADALEGYSCNGSFTHFDAGQANPFVGLTSAPCIAEVMDTDDDGRQSVDGRLWWFPDYVIRDDLEELYRKGYVIYNPVSRAEE